MLHVACGMIYALRTVAALQAMRTNWQLESVATMLNYPACYLSHYVATLGELQSGPTRAATWIK